MPAMNMFLLQDNSFNTPLLPLLAEHPHPSLHPYHEHVSVPALQPYHGHPRPALQSYRTSTTPPPLRDVHVQGQQPRAAKRATGEGEASINSSSPTK